MLKLNTYEFSYLKGFILESNTNSGKEYNYRRALAKLFFAHINRPYTFLFLQEPVIVICAKVLFMRTMADSLVIGTITVTFSDYALQYGYTKRNVQIEEDDGSHTILSRVAINMSYSISTSYYKMKRTVQAKIRCRHDCIYKMIQAQGFEIFYFMRII